LPTFDQFGCALGDWRAAPLSLKQPKLVQIEPSFLTNKFPFNRPILENWFDE
jgi:hypothetical protein